jgi:hypothetical protein
MVRCSHRNFFSTKILNFHYLGYVMLQQMQAFGLEVARWPLVPMFAGSNPAEAVGFFRAKNPQYAFLRRGVKPSAPCRRFTACKRSLNATWKSGISGKIHRPYLAHIVPPLATRISGETTSGESWNL